MQLDDRQAGQRLRIPCGMNPLLKLALELGPLVVFFIGNSQFGIFNATMAFMAATTASLGVSYALTRTIPTMPLVSGVFVMVFGGLTIWLNDELFIKLKPTIVNLLFATILGFGLMTGRLFMRMVLDSALPLTDRGWVVMTRAWIGFFIVLAILNEIVWRSVSTDAWVSFKVFGVMPLTLVFSFSLIPLMNKHMVEVPDDNPPPT